MSNRFFSISLALFLPALTYLDAVKVSDSSFDRSVKKQLNDWKSIQLDQLYFPDHFQFGSAESDYQTAGPYFLDEQGVKQEAISNWTSWVEKRKLELGDILKRWEPSVWQQDYDLIAQSGLNAYRLEAPWSKIEPEKGIFNTHYLSQLKNRISYLQSKGVQVWLCLSHFVWPEWFEAKGAFEEPKNIQDFVEFAKYVYQEIPEVSHWITFNEPLVIPMDGYWGLWYNKLAPGKRHITTKVAATVFKNILDAHVAAYHALKQIDSSRNIGLIDVFAPSSKEKQNIALYGLINAFGWNNLNTIEIDYFTTGTYCWPTLLGSVKDYNSQAIGALDFIGINYYSLAPVGFTIEAGDMRDEKGRLIYPFGLLEAIKKCSVLNVPIYISENGVADSKGLLRDRYIKQHLYIVSKACELGCDVRGYFYWTFMDTFGWNDYKRKYGLYEVNFETQERTLRENATDFIHFLQYRNTK